VTGGFGSGKWADVAKRKTAIEHCRSISASSSNKQKTFALLPMSHSTGRHDFCEEAKNPAGPEYCHVLARDLTIREKIKWPNLQLLLHYATVCAILFITEKWKLKNKM